MKTCAIEHLFFCEMRHLFTWTLYHCLGVKILPHRRQVQMELLLAPGRPRNVQQLHQQPPQMPACMWERTRMVSPATSSRKAAQQSSNNISDRMLAAMRDRVRACAGKHNEAGNETHRSGH